MELSKDQLLELTANESERTFISRGDQELPTRRGSHPSMAAFQTQREAAIATMRSSQVAWSLAAQEDGTKLASPDNDEMVASNAKRPPRGRVASLMQPTPRKKAPATTAAASPRTVSPTLPMPPTICRTPPSKPPPGPSLDGLVKDGDPMEYFSPGATPVNKKGPDTKTKVVTPDSNLSNNNNHRNNDNTPNNIRSSLPGAYAGRPGADLERIGLFDAALLGMEAGAATTNISFDSRGSDGGSDKKSSPQGSPPRGVTWAANIRRENIIDNYQLAQAMPVEEPDGYITEVVEDVDLDPDAMKTKAKDRRCGDLAWAFRRLLVVGALGLTALVLLVVFLRRGGDSGNSPSTPASSHESASLTSFIDLLPDYSQEAMTHPGKPQYEAWQWLVGDPHVHEYPAWRVQQRFALATLYFATDGDMWDQEWNKTLTEVSWLAYDYHECDWPFARGSFIQAEIATEVCTSDPDGGSEQLAHLGLHRQGLQGGIPPELYILTSLVSIDLGWNAITGSLSSQIGQLTDLEQLVVPLNDITGSLPSELNLCRKLTVLHLGNNAFSGSIPNLQPFPDLQELYIFQNQFGGSLPTAGWDCLHSLHAIMLDRNALTGPLPSQLGLLTGLRALDAKLNNFTSALPTEIGNMLALTHLELQGNQCSGEIPTELGNLRFLQTLNLNRNQLSYTIPTELGRLSNLLLLKIDINDLLQGPIPSELGRLEHLTGLFLGRNALSGRIPTEVGLLTHLAAFWLEGNRLTGPILSQLGQLQDLTHLILFDNGLTGPLPSQLGLLQHMEYAFLDENKLTGEIPPELARMGIANNALQVLDVSNNYFHGTVPDGLCDLEDMFVFDCSHRLCGCTCEALCWGPAHN